MILTTVKRIIKTGFINFWRNGFLSFAAIMVITLSLFALGTMIFGSAFGRTLIAQVKEKVDINVYFVIDAIEADVLALQKDVEKLPEVAKVEYVSREVALESFKQKWQNNALIMQGLEEIGNNPFSASFNIKAKEPGQYSSIVNFLENKSQTDNQPLIEKINYMENKLIIDRLGRIIPAVEKTGAVVAAILILVAVIVVWNTIRLIIYTVRDEISVMKLVGASNFYVRGPLVVSGIMYGLISGLITIILMAAFAKWSDVVILRFVGIQLASDFALVVNVLSSYFNDHFGQIFSIIMGTGILLGGLSSYVAARKYLKV